MLRKLLAMSLCLSVVLATFTACDSKDSSGSSSTTTTTSSVDGIEPVVEPEYDYSFPEFLEDKDSISLFSNLIYTSFDSRTASVAVTEQPFENATCEQAFLENSYYSYVSGNKKGLLDAEGNVVLAANYTEIAIIRPDAFLLTNEQGEEKYAYISENGILTSEQDGKNGWFTSPEPLKINQATDSETNIVSYYLEAANGKVVYDKYWDYIEPTLLDTAASASFSAYIGDAYYFIIFDKYYNYKIYEGSYATVEVYAKGQYGSCFVLSIDDFNEISSMIDSFGISPDKRVSPTSPQTDYVKFTFGNTASNKKLVTISADGFVYTESMNPEDGTSYKYFSLVDKICFVDIMDWISDELSHEYVRTR